MLYRVKVADLPPPKIGAGTRHTVCVRLMPLTKGQAIDEIAALRSAAAQTRSSSPLLAAEVDFYKGLIQALHSAAVREWINRCKEKTVESPPC
jgi:hypothetical protein